MAIGVGVEIEQPADPPHRVVEVTFVDEAQPRAERPTPSA